MHTQQLGNALYRGSMQVGKPEDDGYRHVIAAGPITKQPSTVAYRVVLCDLGDKFAVWTQYFPRYTLETADLTGSYMESGDYFQVHDIAEAVRYFGERVVRHASFAASILRALPANP